MTCITQAELRNQDNIIASRHILAEFDCVYSIIVRKDYVTNGDVRTLEELSKYYLIVAKKIDSFYQENITPTSSESIRSALTRISLELQKQARDVTARVEEVRSKMVGHLLRNDPQPIPVIQIEEQPVVRRRRCSVDDMDAPMLHDDFFNFIPATCLETGLALSLLQRPGNAGSIVEQRALQMAEIVKRVFDPDDPLGRTVVMDKAGKETTIKALFEKLLQELHPEKSDQIGRCTDLALADLWDHRLFPEMPSFWLIEQLQDDRYCVSTMLTKIKALSSLGEILYDLGASPKNAAALQDLAGDQAMGRIGQIREKIRHVDFNSPLARARRERMVLLGGELPEQGTVERLFGPEHGHGFGHIIIIKSKTQANISSFSDDATRESYLKHLEEFGGVSGLPRHGSVISNKARPGTLTDSALERIPLPFKEAGLEDLLAHEAFTIPHGIGMNRWQLMGTYPQQSWEQDLPAAGAHSGTTVEFFTALECLGEASIFGNEDEAMQAGLMVSAFMTLGGCHTFVETFPIARAIGTNTRFDVQVGKSHKEALHNEYIRYAQQHVPAITYSKMAGFRSAYEQTLHDIHTSTCRLKSIPEQPPKIERATSNN